MKILLVDNGSLEPSAVLALRAVARALSQKVGAAVFPVSLAYADRIAPSDLGGLPAPVVEPFLRAALAAGERQFVILPFFVGPSRAVTQALPRLVEKLRAELPASAAAQLSVRIAPALHEPGDTTLAQIMAERVRSAIRDYEEALPAGAKFSETRFRTRVALVDHGSPTRAVAQVRDEVAAQLAALLSGEGAEVVACNMERRPGAAYDFNEPLLETVLARPEWRARVRIRADTAAERPVTTEADSVTAESALGSTVMERGTSLVRSAGSADASLTIVAPLFLLPGRHAGPTGDIAQICARARAFAPPLSPPIVQTPPLGQHPLLIERLARRLTLIQGALR